MSTQTGQTGHRCEKGHNMDPSWDKCPYCEAEKNASQRSEPEASSPPNAGNSAGRRTMIDPPTEEKAGGRETRVMPEEAVAKTGNSASVSRGTAPSGAGDTRLIVGVLITYSWHSWGDIFHVRLGKNFIGAGRIGSAPGDPPCDFVIEADKRMSSVHALILCRQGRTANEIRFDLIDQQSSNGTYLNSELAPLQGVNLPNYAKIETGDTEWTFIKIAP